MQIGIAGAGIMGCLLAYTLADQGLQVTLYDQPAAAGQSIQNCSMAAAGLLAPVSELEKSEYLIYQLGMKAITQHWPNILNALGNDVYFNLRGSLLFAHARDQEELRRFLAIIQQKQAGRNGDEDNLYQKLTRDEITHMEPELDQFDEAYYFPQEACIDSQDVMHRLKQLLTQLKVQWEIQHVKQVTPRKIFVDDQPTEYDVAIDCRGMGARATFTDLHAVRGELMWLHAPSIHIQHPIRFIHPRYQQLYLLPRPNHFFILGASEIYAEDYSALSVLSCLEFLTTAYYLNPAFAEARIVKTVTHCRPTLVDYLPKIRYAPGYIAVNGLYRHGFLIAPTLMEEIAQWIMKGESAMSYPELWEQSDG